MKWLAGLLVLFGIGTIVDAVRGEWVFSERPGGAGLIALDIVIGVVCFAAAFVLWRRKHVQSLAVAIPGVKRQSGVGRTLPDTRPSQARSPMEFVNEAQREVYTPVRNWVAALYGESAWIDEEMPRFSAPISDILVGIAILPVGETEAAVNIWTFPLDEGPQELTESALRFMLEANVYHPFGGFGVQKDPDGRVVFEYTVEWEGLTKDRLRSLVVTVALSTRDLRVDLARQLTT